MLKLYRDGTSLAMDVTSARGVFPDGSVRPGTALRLGFGLRVGESNQIVKVDALCQLIGSQRVGEDLLSVVLKFAGFAKNSRARVERFILDAMSYEWVLSVTALMAPPMCGLMEPLSGADFGSQTGSLFRAFLALLQR